MSIFEYINQNNPLVKEKEVDYEIISEPDPEKCASLINARRSRYVIIVYGNLCAYYEGRAKANIELMPRLLITKPDGTLLIHESTKREPVIWQPPGSSLYATVQDKVLIIKSIRHNPREYVIVEIPSIYFVGFAKLGQSLIHKVIGSEKDIVNFIVKNPSIIEDGLEILATEYSTDVGDIDILARDKDSNLVVIEVKRGQAGPEAVHQLKRYVEYIEHKHSCKVRGILVAQDISSQAFKYLREYKFQFVRIKKSILDEIEKVLSNS